MASLDGIANARNSISEAEARTRERIHNPAKVCGMCGGPYEYRLVIGLSSCEHDGKQSTNTPQPC
jgi:hypothetical protein